MLIPLGIVAASGGGAAGSFESIASANGTGSSGTITFSSIPNTYQHLQIRGIVFSAVADYLILRVNSDSGNNYASHFLHGTGTGAAAGGTATTSRFRFDNLNTATNSTYGDVFIIDLHDYANTTRNKTMRSFAGCDQNGDGTVTLASGLWMNTNAINSITISQINGNNFSSTSRFALYGIKGA